MDATIPEPRKYIIPVDQLTVVCGYKTMASYSHGPATAYLAVKDGYKREKWRVRLCFTDGRDDEVKFFTGRNALFQAKDHAYWSVVMPALNDQQIASLF